MLSAMTQAITPTKAVTEATEVAVQYIQDTAKPTETMQQLPHEVQAPEAVDQS